jgi:hypothetical protein
MRMNNPGENGAVENVNDDVMDGIRSEFEVHDRILKSASYDGKALQSETWEMFLEIRRLRRRVSALESTPLYCECSGEDEDPCRTCGASVDGGTCRALYGKKPTWQPPTINWC